MPTTATDHDRAVAAVREWNSRQREAYELLRRLESSPLAVAYREAQATADSAHVSAAEAIRAIPEATVSVDGVKYQYSRGAWDISVKVIHGGKFDG